jgi:CheY-specific phosphatase CheX
VRTVLLGASDVWGVSMPAVEALFASSLSESTGELLDSYHTVPSALPPRRHDIPREDLCIASIGFTGADVRGSLVIMAADEVLAASLSGVARDEATDELFADWAAELANQLCGRLKNKLLRQGVLVTISVPSVLRASGAVHHSRPRPAGVGTAHFSSGTSGFTVSLDVLLAPAFIAGPAPVDGTVATEGELVFL